MKANLKCIALLLAWCLAGPARADVFNYPLQNHPQYQQALRELTLRVQQQGEVSGQFVQTKQVQVLARPIVTRGQFALTAEKFTWQIAQPFAIHYEFAGRQLLRDMDGERQIIEPSAEPLLYGFFSFFASLFNLSEDSLEKLFTVYYLPDQDGKTWVLGLTPKQQSLARSLQELRVHGVAEQILEVHLREKSGDTTALIFSYPALAPPSASDKTP